MLAVHSRSLKSTPRLKLIGAGNAGCNMLDRFVLRTGSNTNSAAVNTDAAHLNACVAAEKVLCGERTAGGLGCGGDPEHALEAWEESSASALHLLEDADVFLFLAGLGGGTGGAFVQRLAAAARNAGKPCFALLTLPFEFEGARKNRHAREILEDIRESASVVAAFPNDALHTFPSASARLAEAFEAADSLLAGAAGSIVSMLSGAGPVQITAGDLFGILAGGKTTWVAHGSGSGPNRAAEAAAALFKCPLLRTDDPLEKSTSVMLHIAAGDRFSIAELDAVTGLVRREFDSETPLSFGISIDASHVDALSLTLLATRRTPRPPAPFATGSPGVEQHVEKVPQPRTPAGAGPAPGLFPEDELEIAPPEESAVATGAPPPVSPMPSEPVKKAAARKLPKQEVLPLDDVARGRFEKSEPTIVEGEDLDIPTFIRWKIRLK